MFSDRVLLDSGRVMVVWTIWPLKRYWGGLTLFSLPLIAHAVRTGMHHHWQAMKLPNSCSGKHFCIWVVSAEALISVWKARNSKRYCETRFTNAITNEIFLPSENAPSLLGYQIFSTTSMSPILFMQGIPISEYTVIIAYTLYQWILFHQRNAKINLDADWWFTRLLKGIVTTSMLIRMSWF